MLDIPTSSKRVPALALLGVVAALAGCVVPIPKKAIATRSAELPSVDVIAAAVLYSPDFSPETPRALGREMVDCITRRVARDAPGVRLVPESDFYRDVFGAAVGAALLRRDTLAELFTRADIAERLRQLGLTHVVLVGGATSRYGQSVSGGAGGGGAGVVSESTKRTRLSASIVDVRDGVELTRVEARSEGGQRIAAGALCCLPFLFGWVPMTESPSCRVLGAEVARTLAERLPHADR